MNWDYVLEKDKYLITMENGKKYFVKVEEIENSMKNLDISEFESLEMWLEDRDYLVNEELEELDKQAKANKPKENAKSSTERKKSTRERKPNPTKENIIKLVSKALEEIATDIVIENVGKIITFKVDNKDFKLDLVEKRVKKEEK